MAEEIEYRSPFQIAIDEILGAYPSVTMGQSIGVKYKSNSRLPGVGLELTISSPTDKKNVKDLVMAIRDELNGIGGLTLGFPSGSGKGNALTAKPEELHKYWANVDEDSYEFNYLGWKGNIKLTRKKELRNWIRKGANRKYSYVVKIAILRPVTDSTVLSEADQIKPLMEALDRYIESI